RLIDENHLHAAARHPERRLELLPDAFHQTRQPFRHRLLALVRVNVEVHGADRPEAKRGVIAVRGPRRRGGGADERRGDNAHEPTPNAETTASASGEALSFVCHLLRRFLILGSWELGVNWELEVGSWELTLFTSTRVVF